MAADGDRHGFELSRVEAIVLGDWIGREVRDRGGRNLATAVVARAELIALVQLGAVLEAALATLTLDEIAFARAVLTPEETALDIDPLGAEDVPLATLPHPSDAVRTQAMADRVPVRLDRGGTLVLFEFLCREVDDRDGRNLLGSFVSPGEFWALNAVQCVLEKGEFYAATLDYPDQVLTARQRLERAFPADFSRFSCLGDED